MGICFAFFLDMSIRIYSAVACSVFFAAAIIEMLHTFLNQNWNGFTRTMNYIDVLFIPVWLGSAIAVFGKKYWEKMLVAFGAFLVLLQAMVLGVGFDSKGALFLTFWVMLMISLALKWRSQRYRG